MTLFFVLLACSGGGKDSAATTATTDSTDGTTTTDSDSGTAGGTATLVGNLSATIPNAIGPYYIGVFDMDPIGNTNAVDIAQGGGPEVDLSQAGSMASYSVPDIPVSPNPIYVIAFLDLNNNFEATGTPDSGDGLALNENAAYSVTLAEAGKEVSLDLVFNLTRP